jgi:hypothetical protein
VIGEVVWMVLAFLPANRPGDPARVVAATMSWQATSVPASRQAAVEREVSEVWRHLGIDVQWRQPRAGELSVTIIIKDETSPPNPGSLPPLGWVNFVGDEPTAVLYASATAAWKSVQAGRTDKGPLSDEPLARQRVLAARLLGRAVAHELGHYLLGTRVHTPRGLMRPILDTADALTISSAAYGLDRNQRAALQQRLALLWVRASGADPYPSRPSGSLT